MCNLGEDTQVKREYRIPSEIKKKKKLNFIFKVVYLDLKLGDLKDI